MRKDKGECINQKWNDLDEIMTSNNGRLAVSVLKTLTGAMYRTEQR